MQRKRIAYIQNYYENTTNQLYNATAKTLKLPAMTEMLRFAKLGIFPKVKDPQQELVVAKLQTKKRAKGILIKVNNKQRIWLHGNKEGFLQIEIEFVPPSLYTAREIIRNAASTIHNTTNNQITITFEDGSVKRNEFMADMLLKQLSLENWERSLKNEAC